MGYVSQTALDYSIEYEIAKAINKASKPNSGDDGDDTYVSHAQKRPYKHIDLTSAYSRQQSYGHNLERSRRDFTRNIPSKILAEFPNSGNEGLYGFTYLGHMGVNRNERLRGTERGYETDVHECIHTDWEYETRVLTWWMIEDDERMYSRN